MRRRQSSELSFSLFAFQDIITAVTGICLLITMILALALINSKRVSQPTTESSSAVETLRADVALLASKVARVHDSILGNKSVLKPSPLTPEDLAIAILAGDQSNSALGFEIDSLNQRLSEIRSATIDDLQQLISEKQKALNAERLRVDRTIEELESQLNHVEEELSDLRSSNQYFFNPPKGFNKKPWLVEIYANRILVAPADQSVEPKQYRSSTQFLASLSEYRSKEDYFVLFAHPTGVNEFNRISSRMLSFDYGVDVLGSEQSLISRND